MCMDPGGLFRSEHKGASHDLKRNATLVAQMSSAMHCSRIFQDTPLPVERLPVRDSNLANLFDVRWMVLWAKLISQPHIGAAMAQKKRPLEQTYAAHFRGGAHTKDPPRRGMLCAIFRAA